jgi:hypothetical protein
MASQSKACTKCKTPVTLSTDRVENDRVRTHSIDYRDLNALVSA